jgi:hypothetical protein
MYGIQELYTIYSHTLVMLENTSMVLLTLFIYSTICLHKKEKTHIRTFCLRIFRVILKRLNAHQTVIPGGIYSLILVK